MGKTAKRLSSIVLALALLLSLATLFGCSKDAVENTPAAETDTTAPENTPATTNPTTGADAETSSGKPLVAVATNNMADELAQSTFNNLGEMLTADGYDFSISDAKFDVALQMSFVENYTTMGAKAVILGVDDPSAFEDCIKTAEAAGTKCIFWGSLPSGYDCAGAVNVKHEAVGTAIGLITRAWLDVAYPDAAAGSVHTCVTRFDNFYGGVIRMDAAEAEIRADERVNVTYIKDCDISVDNGYTTAEEALTADPEIRLFVCFSDSTCIGINNYIMSAGFADTSDFGVFGSGFVDEDAALIEAAKTDGSVFRGTVQTGINPSQSIYDVVKALLVDGVEEPYYAYDVLVAQTCFGYDLPEIYTTGG